MVGKLNNAPIRELAPSALVLGVALSVSSYLSVSFLLPSQLILAHTSLACAFLVGTYWLRAYVMRVVRNEATQRRVIASLGLSCGLVFATFYASLFISLVTLREYPTRGLVLGYLRELPLLVAALPIDWPLLVLSATGIAAAIGAFCTVYAWGFLGASGGRPRSPLLRLVAESRLIAYPSILYVTVTLSMPTDWHLRVKEPIASSWHDARIGSTSQYGQRNPVEVLNDRRIERQYGAWSAKSTKNIILIYVDALRADATQPYGGQMANMPFMTEAVRSGRLLQVDMTLAACSGTICGLAAILQSRPTWKQDPNNFSLPRLLAKVGYRTAYVLSSNHQSYFDLKQYYEPIDFYLDGKDIDPHRSTDDYNVLKGLERLGRWDGRPIFLMIGLVSPHPLAYRKEQHRKFQPDKLSLSGGSDGYTRAYRNNYHNGVLQADDVLARVWQWLEDNNYLRDAVMVITSDHGESLGERKKLGHLNSLYNSELWVPLWISAPNRAIRNTRLARQVDIAPTVLSILGIPVPSSWTGVSLTEEQPAEWSYHYLPDKPSLVAMVRFSADRAVKFIYDHTTRLELAFDLEEDRNETRNIVDQLPEHERKAFRNKAIQILFESKQLLGQRL